MQQGTRVAVSLNFSGAVGVGAFPSVHFGCDLWNSKGRAFGTQGIAPEPQFSAQAWW